MMKVKFRTYHEELLKAVLLLIVVAYFFTNYESFIEDIGHMATNTKGKLLQAVFATLDKVGGKYLVAILLSIPIINLLLKARKEYKESKKK